MQCHVLALLYSTQSLIVEGVHYQDNMKDMMWIWWVMLSYMSSLSDRKRSARFISLLASCKVFSFLFWGWIFRCYKVKLAYSFYSNSWVCTILALSWSGFGHLVLISIVLALFVINSVKKQIFLTTRVLAECLLAMLGHITETIMLVFLLKQLILLDMWVWY